MMTKPKVPFKSPKNTVHVSTVKLRSPFRYPGGKTWLVPHIRQWLTQHEKSITNFIEPFAGGGIVSLTVAAEDFTRHITMVERDEEMAAAWQTILYGDVASLVARISAFEVTRENVQQVLTQSNLTIEERAFRTILRNRVSRGGILAPGAGLLKSGENGKGLKSRWYPDTLKKRILEIVKLKHKITFIEGDGLEVLRQNLQKQDVVFFIDPPYTAGGKSAGSRLYTYWEVDHEELFRIIAKAQGDFLMAYENSKDVHDLAAQYGFDTEPIGMRNTHHTSMTELLIGSDLAWARMHK